MESSTSSPSAWVEIAKAAPSVVTAGAAIWGLLIAKAGLTKWRQETIGKRKAELAEQALICMYEARDVFRWVRSRVIFSGEGDARASEQEESTKLKARRNRYSVPIERLQAEKELFARLQSQRYAFAAYFGPDAAQPFVVIGELHQQIMGAAGILIQMAHHEDIPSSAYNNDLEGLKDTIGWGRARHPDEIDKKIDDAIKEIEAICRPILMELSPRVEVQTRGDPRDHVDWFRRP